MTRDQTRGPLHWEGGVLTTGPPGKSLSHLFLVGKTLCNPHPLALGSNPEHTGLRVSVSGLGTPRGQDLGLSPSWDSHTQQAPMIPDQAQGCGSDLIIQITVINSNCFLSTYYTPEAV